MTSKEEEYISGFDFLKYKKTLSSDAIVWAENVIKFTEIKKISKKRILLENVQRSNILAPAIVKVPGTGSLMIINTF